MVILDKMVELFSIIPLLTGKAVFLQNMRRGQEREESRSHDNRKAVSLHNNNKRGFDQFSDCLLS